MENIGKIDLYFIFFAGTGGMLLLFAGVLLIFRAYHKKLLAAQEERAARELAHRDELLYNNMLATEKERARIARDLHDEVSASLSLLKLQVRELPPPVFAEVRPLIDNTIDSVRRISYDLLPPVLQSFGLVAAVQAFLEKATGDAGIRVTLDSFDEYTRFPAPTELSAYRILQELVHNTLKHAGASAIAVRLEHTDHRLNLVYHDNGKGYDPGQQRKDAGLGLKNIEVRARQCLGSVAYRQLADNSIEVTISIPATIISNHE